MGVYDRDYYRDDDGGGRYSPRSMTVTLIMINVGVFLVDLLWDGKLSQFGNLEQFWYKEPWKCYQLLTYGFLHSVSDIRHILFNMFALWIFGTGVENVYGRREFLRNYLSLVVLAGLAWTVAENVAYRGGPEARMVGASGAISGMMIIYILHYPHQQFLLFFVLPVPAWVMGLLYIAQDVWGLMQQARHVALPANEPIVAVSAHLGGAFFGYLYYRTHWSLLWFLPKDLSWRGLKKTFRPKPKLRVHDRDRDDEPAEDNLQERVDEILAKISRSGESSLTPDERRTLEEASRRYQKKRR